ncbi:MAG: glycosyltransferase family 9 protein [Paludibacteraceae bacterium]|nr:glycosyltransferase family 9 protein [Paludibacteraceae bacterium]MBQ9705683.1 glycosyltransferase family 9 protein [Paludibacteraceae bacterium]
MRRILVIRFSALGDTALLVPVVCAAARAYPDRQFIVLSQERYAGLWQGMPANVRFAGADLHGRHHGRKGLDRLLREQRLGQADAVADMHGVWRSRYLTLRLRLHGADAAGIHKQRLARFLLTRGLCRRQLPTAVQRYLDVFSRLGMPLGEADVRAVLPPQGSGGRQGIGIAPFAAHRGKTYPAERMQTVVRLLAERGERVVLFGGRGDEQRLLDSWAAQYNGVESVAGRFTLAEEIQLMQGLRLMLTMDSANMHLASLAGTRVVSIWGATHPLAGFLGCGQQPADCIGRDDLNCRPCSVYGKRSCRYGDYRCLDIAEQTIVRKLYD